MARIPLATIVTCAAALSFAAAPVFAARPLDTEDTGILEPGKVELELSMDVTKTPGDVAGAGTAVLNLGVVRRLEVSVELSAAYVVLGPGPDEARFGDTILGAKYRLLDETPVRPAVLANVRLRLPTHDGDGAGAVGQGGVDVLVRLAASKSFGPVTVTVNAGYVFATADRAGDRWLASGAVEHQLSRAWWLVAEVSALVGVRAGDVAVARGGIVYALTRAVRLDLAAGTRLTRARPDLIATTGITIGF